MKIGRDHPLHRMPGHGVEGVMCIGAYGIGLFSEDDLLSGYFNIADGATRIKDTCT